MKDCRSCQRARPLDEFYRYSTGTRGLMPVCKDCVRARVRARYAETREVRAAYERRRFQTPERKAAAATHMRRYRERHPERQRAHNAVSNAIRDGRLIRQPCEECGTHQRVEAHHHDYLKPLDVRWLCFTCHRTIEHGQTVVAA